MEKNGLGARNPSVRLVWHESKCCGNKRPKSEVICAGVGMARRITRFFLRSRIKVEVRGKLGMKNLNRLA